MSNFIDLVKLDEQIKKNEIIYQIKMTKGQNELTEEEIKLITEQIRIEKVKLSDHQTESSFIVNRIDEVNKLSREFEIFLHSDSDNESENEKEKKNEEENIEEEKEKKIVEVKVKVKVKIKRKRRINRMIIFTRR